VVAHDLCGPVRALPGQPVWHRTHEALPALLQVKAGRGDRTAAKLLAELPRLFGQAKRTR